MQFVTMAEEDAELKELVIQSLESNGVLAKIRAQLRASVFLALDEANTLQKKPLENKELKTYLETKNGQLIANLIREFLNYFNLDSTLSVFESETSVSHLYSPKDRQSLTDTLGFLPEEVVQVPLIDTLAAKYIGQFKIPNQEASASESSSAVKETKSDQHPESQNLFPMNNGSNDDDNDEEEDERDPFFDDPVPKSINNFPQTSLKSKVDENPAPQPNEGESDLPPNHWNSSYEIQKDFTDNTENSPAVIPEKKQDMTFTVPSTLSSLKTAPALFESKGKLPPLWNDTRTINKLPETKSRALLDEDYEEDFQSSASIRSDQKTGTEYSIEEDIEENFSGIAEDLLSNEGISETDDTTTDHTISNIGVAGADYLESVG